MINGICEGSFAYFLIHKYLWGLVWELGIFFDEMCLKIQLIFITKEMKPMTYSTIYEKKVKKKFVLGF